MSHAQYTWSSFFLYFHSISQLAHFMFGPNSRESGLIFLLWLLNIDIILILYFLRFMYFTCIMAAQPNGQIWFLGKLIITEGHHCLYIYLIFAPTLTNCPGRQLSVTKCLTYILCRCNLVWRICHIPNNSTCKDAKMMVMTIVTMKWKSTPRMNWWWFNVIIVRKKKTWGACCVNKSNQEKKRTKKKTEMMQLHRREEWSSL